MCYHSNTKIIKEGDVMANKNRNFFIDIVKGLAIFLMIWGHCIQYCVANSNVDYSENQVFKCIYSFHMPLFMLISGYLFFYSFSKRNLKELLIHRTQTLLQPIVFCSVFNYFATEVLGGVITGSIAPAFSGQWLENLSSLWFLWSVLAASLVTAVVCKKVNNVFVQLVLLVIAIPIIAMFPNRDMNLFMYPYFVLGFYFSKYKDRLPNIVQKLKYISLPLFPVLLCFYEKKHYIYTTGLLPNEKYSFLQMVCIDTYRWLIGLVGSLFVITVLQLVYNHIIIKVKTPRLSNALSKMGEKSIQMYAFSVPFVSIYLSVLFPKVLGVLNMENIFVNNMFVYNYVFTLLLSVGYSFVLYVLIKCLDKLKITKVMFGN